MTTYTFKVYPLEKSPSGGGRSISVESSAQETIEKRDEADRLAVERRVNRNLQRDNEALRRSLEAVGVAKAATPHKRVRFKKKSIRGKKSKGTHSMVGPQSDLHFFEDVDPDRMRVGGGHSGEIGKARYEQLIYHTIKQHRFLSTRFLIPEFHLILNGDYMVGREMHFPDSSESVALSPLREMREVTAVMRDGIQFLLDNLDVDFKVTCVPGNHGRAGEKRFSKENEYNYEHFIHLALADHFEGTDRIEFDVTPHVHKFVDIGGVTVGVIHGDPQLKGGDRLPASCHKTWRQLRELEPDMQFFCAGHVHQDFCMPELCNISGAMVSYNEYAQRFLMRPVVPSQSGFLVSHDEGRMGMRWRYWFDA